MMNTVDIISSNDLVPIIQNGKTRYISTKNLFELVLNAIPREEPQELCLDKQKEEIKHIWKSLQSLTDKLSKAIIQFNNSYELSKSLYCKIEDLTLRVKELEVKLDSFESQQNYLTQAVENLQQTNNTQNG